MKMNRSFSLLIVFISGLVIGVFAGQFILHLRFMHIMRKGPQKIERFFLRQLTDKLSLTDQQIAAVEPITRDTVFHIDNLRKQSMATAEEKVDEMLRSLRPFLDEKQQAVLDTLTAKDMRPGPPFIPPPPPSVTDHENDPPGHRKDESP